MDLDDRLKYRALQRKSINLYNAGKYKEAMKIDKESIKLFPDLKTATYYSMIASASKMKDYKLSCELLKEILDEGGWYSEMILRQSPSLAPLQGAPEFEELVKLSVRRSQLKSENEDVIIFPKNVDPPSPLIVSLHGGGGFVRDEFEHWKPIVDQGFILGLPRSSNLFWSGMDNAYWSSYESSVQQVKTFIEKINKENFIDFKRLFLGGFSQGGGFAVQMVISGDIPACGFIVISPGGSFIDESDKWQSMIDKTKNRHLRGIIIRGTEDLAIPRDKLHKLAKLLNENGINCEFFEYPGLGHWYPPDLVDLISSFNLF